MEISPRRSLSLDFDASLSSPTASSYPPTYQNYRSNMYTTHGMKPAQDSKTARPFAMTSSMSMDSGSESILAPKKENFISSMFNVFTSAVMERIAKVPNTFMNNLNSTLSVTVVPNEGIISQDFFKTLTRSSEQLASENQNENDIDPLNMPEKMPSKLLYDSKSQMSYVFSDKLPTKESLEIKDTIDKSIENESEGKLTSAEAPEINDILCHIKDLTTEASFNSEILPVDESESPSICREETDININTPCSSRSKQSEITTKNSIYEDNCAVGWQTVWQRVVNGMSDHLKPRTSSPESEIPTKKPNLAVYPHTKPRKKTACTLARIRGKGRGKSQLRRSGVSQSRHRKERTKQDIYSNIQDDLEAFEVSDSYDSGNEDGLQGIRANEEQNLSPSQESRKRPSTLFENVTFDETDKPRKRKQRNGSVKGSSRVRYVPESAMEVDPEDSHDSLPKVGGFRPRLVSESSVDSEDSYCIVFEKSSSESEYDCNYDSVSDEESEEDVEEDDDDDDDGESSECDDDETTLRVRFNLEPQVHTMIKWNYAYRAARKGPWEEMARDRERFRGRIRCIERILDPILAPQHRKCVWQDRFDVDG